jgi:flagellar biosynthesis protein FlhF
MYLKSFFAATVEGALAEGSRELGRDALIVQSRPAPPESRHLGRYEVVLAVEAGAPAGQSSPRLAPAGELPVREEPLARELAELRRQMDSMRRSLSCSALSAPRWLAPSSQSAAIFTALIESEVEANLAQQIAERVAAQLGATLVDEEHVRRAAAAEIESRFSVDASLGREGDSCRIAALVGPPGSGKTTTLIKLAVVYGLAARRPVMLISADTDRIAAADQLRAYAAILGVGFELVETPRALDQTLHVHRGKELILIDTPGLAAADMERGADLAAYLASRPEIDTHLVLSASMKSADITRAVDRFEIFRPGKLLFTRLDETDSWGGVLTEAARTGKPLSFLAAGQQIPEHLEPATKSRVLDLLFPTCYSASLAAA